MEMKEKFLELTERLAEYLGASQTEMVICTIIVLSVLLGLVIFGITMLFIWYDRRSECKFYQEDIAETEKEVLQLRLKIAELEDRVEFAQSALREKILKAVEGVDLMITSEETQWLVKICYKNDYKKLREKLAKKRDLLESDEEWLREARTKCARLSEKLGK